MTILAPVTNPDKLPKKQKSHRRTQGIRAVASGAESAGVKIALEEVGGSPIITGEKMKAKLEAIDSPAVGAYFEF